MHDICEPNLAFEFCNYKLYVTFLIDIKVIDLCQTWILFVPIESNLYSPFKHYWSNLQASETQTIQNSSKLKCLVVAFTSLSYAPMVLVDLLSSVNSLHRYLIDKQ
ncbi:hypothetical protein STEG23_037500, partial [Scotinomys teguina]